MKKVLIVNKFYYPRGGDCLSAISLEHILQANGFQTAIFTMDYHENISSQSPIYTAPEVSFAGGISNKIAGVTRVMGFGNIRNAFKHALDNFAPDVVHFHNIHSYLSPIMVKMAHDAGARTVWTMHDYKLVCPAYACRNAEKTPCEDCFANGSINPFGVIKHRCMKGSLASSAIAYIEALKWNRGVLEKYTDAFVCPSNFMRTKLTKAGYSPSKLHIVNNTVDDLRYTTIINSKPVQKENFYVYIGRLSAEKGIHTLLEVASRLPYTLRVLGSSPDFQQIVDKYRNFDNIEFLGQCDGRTVVDNLLKAKMSVIPSEWFENNPISAIESLLAGTPVVGANIGGIPELLTPDNGILFESGNSKSLAEAINTAFKTTFDYNAIHRSAMSNFSPETFLNNISNIYKAL